MHTYFFITEFSEVSKHDVEDLGPLSSKPCSLGLLWLYSGLDSVLPMQGTQVRSLVRELDPISCNEDQRSCVPQLGPGTVR